MKLSKSDALLIHSTLYMTYNTQGVLSEDYRDQIGDILDDLSDFLIEDESDSTLPGVDHEDLTDDSSSEVYDEDEDEDEDEDKDEPQPEEFITGKDADELTPISVISPSGAKVSLEFEDVGEKDTVDALLDDGGIIIDSVSCVVLDRHEISLYDGESWHDFKVRKIPKQWSKTFKAGKITGFEAGEE